MLCPRWVVSLVFTGASISAEVAGEKKEGSKIFSASCEAPSGSYGVLWKCPR